MSKRDTTEFLRVARERFTAALAQDREDREVARADARFANGEQWHPADERARKKAKRPVMTWNRLGVFTAQVINDGRQSKPSIKVTPMDNGTPETAELIQGRMRHIEYESDADIAYDTARECVVTSGRGFYRVKTRYKPGSFEQEARVERIEDQFSVLWGPGREYDRSDAAYCFVSSRMSREDFEAEYGKDRDVVVNGWYMDGENPAPEWVGIGTAGDEIQVAEYWHKEITKRTLCRLATGEEMPQDELPPSTAPSAIVETRKEDVVTVVQSVINGVEILEETEWICPLIPIISQWGRESMVDGKRRTRSLIHNAKDAQRLVNLYVSNIAEQIAQMPKSPYMVAEGQVAGREDEWATINTVPRAYVQYKPLAIGGTVIGRPERIVNEPPIQALTIGLNQALDGMKAAMGIFDAALGAQARETSGIAIQRRAKESDNANFHFHDNEGRSRKYFGRVLFAVTVALDKGSTQITIRTEDGKTEIVPLGVPHLDKKTGKTIVHDLARGDYGVAISTGPNFTSQRAEAFDTYSQIATADKNFMTIAGDLLFRNMDAPGADQIADRYEKILPPPLQPKKPGQQQAQIPPQVQQQMQVMSQQHEQLVATVHQLTDEIQAKRFECDSRERIARMQEDTKRTIALANISSSEGLTVLEHEITNIRQMLGRQHDAGMADAATAASSEAQQQQHEHEQQQAQAAQEQPQQQEQLPEAA